jgi:hypothetical protein
MRRLIAPAVALVVVFAGAVHWLVPHLTAQRPVVTSTPSLQGQWSLNEVKVRSGQRACIAPLPLDPGVREVQMLVHGHGSAPAPIAIELSGPGYTGRARFDNYIVSAATPVQAQFDRPPSGSTDGTMCLRNLGRHSIGLVGTSEPESLSLPATTVDGRPAGEIDPAITFLSGEHRSTLQRASTIFDRAAGFTGVVPAVLMWPLALLVFLGIPLGAVAALYLAPRRNRLVGDRDADG